MDYRNSIAPAGAPIPWEYMRLGDYQPASPAQMPLVWPRLTQLAEHAQEPRLHLRRRRGRSYFDLI